MYEIFVELCRINGVTAYKVGKETGIASSTFTDWKNGRSEPKKDKLQKIADYFNVSIDYLMTGETKKYTIEVADEDTKLIFLPKEIKEYAIKLSELSVEDRKDIMKMIDRLGK